MVAFHMKLATLDDIACRYGTDKSTLTSLPRAEDGYISRPSQGHGYTFCYAHYFEPLRFGQIRLLEIGVLDGRSLATWKEYLPNAQLYGLDIDPSCMRFADERTKIFVGSQTDTAFLASIRVQVPQGFDIIIDDGSHFVRHVITSYRELFRHLKPGGFYVIEDLHVSRDLSWGEVSFNKGMDLQKEKPGNDAYEMVTFLESVRAQEDVRGLSVHFKKICFIQKRRPDEPRTEVLRGDPLQDLMSLSPQKRVGRWIRILSEFTTRSKLEAASRRE